LIVLTVVWHRDQEPWIIYSHSKRAVPGEGRDAVLTAVSPGACAFYACGILNPDGDALYAGGAIKAAGHDHGARTTATRGACGGRPANFPSMGRMLKRMDCRRGIMGGCGMGACCAAPPTARGAGKR